MIKFYIDKKLINRIIKKCNSTPEEFYAWLKDSIRKERHLCYNPFIYKDEKPVWINSFIDNYSYTFIKIEPSQCITTASERYLDEVIYEAIQNKKYRHALYRKLRKEFNINMKVD